MKKSHLGFWFYLHIAVVLLGIFLIPGTLGWVLATFSAACAWLIYKFPYPKEPRFVEYDDKSGYDVDWLDSTEDPLTDPSYSFLPGNIYHHDDSSFTDMDDSITNPGYAGINYFGD